MRGEPVVLALELGAGSAKGALYARPAAASC
jgi:hypothetical protein